jgi:CRP/FNR family transcriptional regulator, anaerobic regulatory protein
MKTISATNCAAHPHQSVRDCAHCDVREIAVCTALSGPELERLKAIAVYKAYETGETVFAAEEPTSIVGTIVRGTIKTFKLLPDGRQQVVGFLFPGDFIGSVTHDANRYFAEALTPVEICILPYSGVQRMIHETPNLERQLLKLASDDLDLAQEWMLLLGRKTAQERLATFLLLLVDKAKARGADEVKIDLPMNRTEIADYLGLTIETVSRQFSKLRSAGIIGVENNHQVSIRSRVHLAATAEGSA